ncbi:hypothetical protein [Legionella parisiensis]|uniref:OTU domain-containing protein n=1 Tax=Legionella parisiensis TaxID=45071 RepID=A0A1E5JMS9_9GAMM|nr:hypothetical protein [Legionella parisiensis]KTD42279.1 Dot/Icm T4SS effector [Legionella parisiensis]OEH45831.1 hypothetical protein lpari_03150 [Legionella parisiensis]STX72347.1 Dot/Icm T4SS effector [Legionella parisiensis]
MFHVDNSGDGNCMYYAYSISLMYFLRTKYTLHVTEDIFNKLKLKEDDKGSLRTLLSKEVEQEFTSDEIKTVIEPILGRATRDLAAEHTKYEFKMSPQDTPLFSAAKYGLEYCFKLQFEPKHTELAQLINHAFTDDDYTEAEIYQVSGIKTAMDEFANARFLQVKEEFDREWSIKEQSFKKGKRPTATSIQSQKTHLLDNILRKETVAFFSADNDKHLNEYKNHLQKEHTWGAEETLFVLHRAIQGERMERNTKGTIDTFYDHDIVLHLHRDGSSPFIQSGNPVMILDNQDNTHWISKIPNSIFSMKQFSKITQMGYPAEIALFVKENKQSGPRVAKALRQMYKKWLEGNEYYSPDRCKEITERYLDYVKHNNRRFLITEVERFLEEMNKIIKKKTVIDKPTTSDLSPTLETKEVNSPLQMTTDKLMEEAVPALEAQERTLDTPVVEGFTPLMLQEYPIPNGDELTDKDKSTANKKAKQFTHPYSDEDVTMLYQTIYDWVDSLTDKSFRNLISSSLKKYEAKIWGSLWGASRRAEVEGYLNGNYSSKALAMILINGHEESTFSGCLFVKIVELIKKEINSYPVMLEEPKYQLISQFNLKEHGAFYLTKMKSHDETISVSQRQLQDTSTLTC